MSEVARASEHIAKISWALVDRIGEGRKYGVGTFAIFEIGNPSIEHLQHTQGHRTTRRDGVVVTLIFGSIQGGELLFVTAHIKAAAGFIPEMLEHAIGNFFGPG